MKLNFRFLRYGGLAAALFVAGALQGGSLTQGLVVHLKFDSDYNDSSGRGNHGTAVGAPQRVPGLIGANALQFSSAADGSSFNYVTLNNTSGTTPDDLLFGDSIDFSVAFWLQLTNWTGDPAFFSNKNWNSGNNTGYVLATAGDGHLQWNIREFDATTGIGNDRRDYDGPAGTLGNGTWHHVAMVVERTGNVRTYLDGQEVDSRPLRSGTDVAATIDTTFDGLAVNVGQDGTGTYTDGNSVGTTNTKVDDLGVWRRALTATEVFRAYTEGLKGVDIANVPDPTAPYVGSALPSDGATAVAPDVIVTVDLQDGSTQVDTNSIQMAFNGSPVAPSISKVSSTNTLVTYDPPGLLPSRSTNTYRIVFADSGSPAVSTTNDYTFVIAGYTNLDLPAPLFFENFDTVAEAAVPTGWRVENFTTDITPGEDLNDPGSDSYKNWVIISRQRVIDVGNAGDWDGPRRLQVAPGQVVGGKAVTSLISSNFFYAESDTRGGSQVQYLFTPSYNLTGKSDIWVVFNSIYEQNQDSIASVEYSVDNGTTWLPILYMVDRDDLIYTTNATTGEVSIDGYATLNEPRGDAASYTDPISGETIGGTYGAFIGVASSLWSTLSPYISGRINDDPIESKRVEAYRLPQADGKASVSFRFAQAGTGSWYFGIDNFGLYSIAGAAPLIGSASVSGGSITITWAGAAGVVLQKAASLTNPTWEDIPSTDGQSTFSEPASAQTMFYRVKR